MKLPNWLRVAWWILVLLALGVYLEGILHHLWS
jgi:hypothetical protein